MVTVLMCLQGALTNTFQQQVIRLKNGICRQIHTYTLTFSFGDTPCNVALCSTRVIILKFFLNIRSLITPLKHGIISPLDTSRKSLLRLLFKKGRVKDASGFCLVFAELSKTSFSDVFSRPYLQQKASFSLYRYMHNFQGSQNPVNNRNGPLLKKLCKYKKN